MAASDSGAETEPAPVLRERWLERPHPTRFDSADPAYEAALAAHGQAVAAGRPGYLDPSTGLFVMTALHLRDRGWCCDRGCRHCPYIGATNGK